MEPIGAEPIDAEKIAQDTLEFVRVQSETGDEGRAAEFFADLLRREGFEPRIDEVEADRPNVYARWSGAGGGPSLVFNGHTDTIPIGDSLPPARDGDWIVGRGAEDMKGGLVAMVHAASALRRAGARLRGDVWLTAVIDHETPRGKKLGPRRLIERMCAREVPADAIVIVEGPWAVWSASLGSAIFRVRIESPRGIVHTIHVPFRENPAAVVGRLLSEFEALERGFEQAVPHPLCGRERLNVGIVQAGDYPNRLPSPATVTGTWRWMPGKTHARVKEQMEALCGQLARETGMSVTVEFEGQREPFETPAAHPLVLALQEAAATIDAPAERIGMGLVCDANLYANEAGVQTVCFGPAYRTAHSDDERVSASQLAQCARVYAGAARRYCAAG